MKVDIWLIHGSNKLLLSATTATVTNISVKLLLSENGKIKSVIPHYLNDPQLCTTIVFPHLQLISHWLFPAGYCLVCIIDKTMRKPKTKMAKYRGSPDVPVSHCDMNTAHIFGSVWSWQREICLKTPRVHAMWSVSISRLLRTSLNEWERDAACNFRHLHARKDFWKRNDLTPEAELDKLWVNNDCLFRFGCTHL